MAEPRETQKRGHRLKVGIILGCVGLCVSTWIRGSEFSPVRALPARVSFDYSRTVEVSLEVDLNHDPPAMTQIAAIKVSRPATPISVMLKITLPTGDEATPEDVEWAFDVVLQRDGQPVTGGRAYIGQMHRDSPPGNLFGGATFIGPARPGQYDFRFRLFDPTGHTPVFEKLVIDAVHVASPTK